VYGKAELRLDDCDSLQLVGPNNIGKSTLIYALNFLFIIDGNKMSFSGQRKGDKETIHHYFPTPNQSYIIFEIQKGITYCILVKRDSDGELEYFRLDTPYRDDLFFVREGGMQRIMKFEEVKERLQALGVVHNQYRNKTEVLNTVYQRGRDNTAAVWLEENVKTDGLSNNFSKIYRYLINTKLITNKTLKQALIIADNRENEGVNFLQKNKRDIVDLLRINDEIKAIKEVKNEFYDFRETVNLYNAKNKNLSELVFAFRENYNTSTPLIEKQWQEKDLSLSKLQNELNEVLKPQRDELNQKIGKKETEIAYQGSAIQARKRELDEIKRFENIEYQQQVLSNLDAKRKEVESRITTLEHQRLSGPAIQQQLKSVNEVIARLQKQLANYDDLLIHKIATKNDHKKLLNSLLSDQVTSLPGSKVKKKIKQVKDLLNIFDGEIDISEGIELRDFKSVEELRNELQYQESEKSRLEILLSTAVNLEKAQKELSGYKLDIKGVEEKIRKIQDIPNIEKHITDLEKVLVLLHGEKDELLKTLKNLTRTISKHEIQLQEIGEEMHKLQNRLHQLRTMKEEVDLLDVEALPHKTEDDLEVVYNKIKLQLNDRGSLKAAKDKAFEFLRNKLQSNLADEQQFIRFVEDELACLSDKEKSIEGLLQSISTQFANPAYTLIKRYEEFREFIHQQFNAGLSRRRISDIESLKVDLLDNKKVLTELRKISSIKEISGQMMLNFDQGENLQVLNQYLDAGRKVSFDELFDLELRITIRGTEKVVDLAAQVESDGTDRMIRLVIIMSVINRLAIHDHDNRITLFIDEVATIDKQNRPELVKFCQDHHFIPIFAAPDPVPGFNKYYFIYPGKGKINLNEQVNVMFSNPRKTGKEKETAQTQA
jgi:hypothetical protein